MRILCCNVRYYGGRDGDNHWNYRKSLCARVIRSRRPDIVCTQEMSIEQHRDMIAFLPEYAWYGMVDTTNGMNPQNAIYYRRDAFWLISSGGYWLSATPHVAGSSSWESSCVRLANWVRLVETSTGAELRVVNTHLDHVSQPAREGQAALINADATAYAAERAQVLTGDMNCDGTNAALKSFIDAGWVDTYASVHGPGEPGFTFHGFEGTAHRTTLGKIDWVFVRGSVRVLDAEIVRDSEGGRYPSDHYFVGATIEIEG